MHQAVKGSNTFQIDISALPLGVYLVQPGRRLAPSAKAAVKSESSLLPSSKTPHGQVAIAPHIEQPSNCALPERKQVCLLVAEEPTRRVSLRRVFGRSYQTSSVLKRFFDCPLPFLNLLFMLTFTLNAPALPTNALGKAGIKQSWMTKLLGLLLLLMPTLLKAQDRNIGVNEVYPDPMFKRTAAALST